MRGRSTRQQPSSGRLVPGRSPTPAGPGLARWTFTGECLWPRSGSRRRLRRPVARPPFSTPATRSAAPSDPDRRLRHRAPGGGARGSSSTGDRAPASGGAARSARPSRPGSGRRCRFFHHGEQPHPPVALGAGEDVHGEGARQELRPRAVGGFRGIATSRPGQPSTGAVGAGEADVTGAGTRRYSGKSLDREVLPPRAGSAGPAWRSGRDRPGASRR